jgi:hypothetical protein
MSDCLKAIGSISASQDKQLVSKIFGGVSLLKGLDIVMIKGANQHRTECLWILANLAINSREDALLII